MPMTMAHTIQQSTRPCTTWTWTLGTAQQSSTWRWTMTAMMAEACWTGTSLQVRVLTPSARQHGLHSRRGRAGRNVGVISGHLMNTFVLEVMPTGYDPSQAGLYLQLHTYAAPVLPLSGPRQAASRRLQCLPRPPVMVAVARARHATGSRAVQGSRSASAAGVTGPGCPASAARPQAGGERSVRGSDWPCRAAQCSALWSPCLP